VVGAVSAERVSPDEEGCFTDFLPVKASQMDMTRKVRFENMVVKKKLVGKRPEE
jgi:hypothetical protein